MKNMAFNLAKPSTTFPYSDVESLLNWEKDVKENPEYLFKKHIIPYNEWKNDNTRPKTLLCHDMKGGYLEDKYDQGFPSSDCYHFYHWHLIDTFCYFSHAFITVPPVSWINAAHGNGVKVLGTILTEWDDGTKNLNAILKSRDSIHKVVDSLVGLASVLKFEGWLVNIEVEVQEEQVGELVYFVQHLTNKMHESNENSVVIWYDSVISNGKLKWQDKLCEENKLFFDVCDGMFLNYNWSPQHLQHSVEMAGEQRKHDVYVGVDVFGRGCLGGGGWNTYQAMQVIRQYSLSAAIFAFGWVYEKLGVEEFRSNNEKYWELLSNYLYPHLMKALPLVTSFCRGFGDGFYHNGKRISDRGWYNLSLTSPQPTYSSSFQCPDKGLEITKQYHCTEDAFSSGGCMAIAGKVTGVDKQKVLFRLFKTNFEINKNETPLLFVSYSYKCKTGVEVDPSLVLVYGQSEEKELVCSGAETEGEHEAIFTSVKSKEQHNQWITRSYYYDIKDDVMLVKEINFSIEVAASSANKTEEFECLLGEIRICQIPSQDVFTNEPTLTIAPPKIYTHLTVPHHHDDNRLVFNILLQWESIMADNDLIDFFDVYGACADTADGIYFENVACETESLNGREDSMGVFLGRTKATFYQLCNLVMPNNCAKGVLLFTVLSMDVFGRSGTSVVELKVDEDLHSKAITVS